MSFLIQKYLQYCGIESDINEHLPTLYRYAVTCNHITECGVRGVVSSYAFASGLLNNPQNKLVQVDIDTNEEVEKFGIYCQIEGIQRIFYHQSDLKCPVEPTDLLFIDTLHVYGQLKRELERWHNYVHKYIILHDTTVDEWYGEIIRCNLEPETYSEQTGIPLDEIRIGLWPAIEEFLKKYPQWKIKERFTNNNGLTILQRI